MNTETRILSFWPSHAQFVLYDTQAEFNPDEEPLWGGTGETESPLSVRRTEVSVGLLVDAEVHVRLSVYSAPPELPQGNWNGMAEASILVASGELGVRDVIADVPEVSVTVPPGWLRIRVIGGYRAEQQTFYAQVWPMAGQED